MPRVYAVAKGRRRHEVLWSAWQRSGMTQQAFARALGMTPQSFNMLLNRYWVPRDPRGLPLEQQRALYQWTGLLPEELWPRRSEDFLDAAGVRMVRVDPRRLADERVTDPDGELGRLECIGTTLRRLDPFSQRVMEQLAIREKSGDLVGGERCLSRERISQIYRKGMAYLRDLARQGLLECCAR